MFLDESQQLLLEKFKAFPRNSFSHRSIMLDRITELMTITSINFVEEDTGRTLLHYAARVYRLDLLQVLLNDTEFASIIDIRNLKGNTAIEVAAMYGNFLVFQALHEKKAVYSPKEVLKKLRAVEPKNSFQDKKLQTIIAFIYANHPKTIYDNDGDRVGVYAYPASLKEHAQKEEFQNQKIVTERFFRVGKKLKQAKNSTKLYGEILTAMDMQWTIVLDSYSARAVVIALSKILQKFTYFPSLVFKLGDTELQCVPSDNRDRQIGNLTVTILNLQITPDYGNELMQYIDPVLGKKIERQQQLAKLFQVKSKRMQSFTLEEFNAKGWIKLEDEAPFKLNQNNAELQIQLQNVIHVLNFLNFMHVVGEIVRRLYRTSEGNVYSYHFREPASSSDQFPVASFHARVIDLMAKGTIKLNEIYGIQPRYGVVAEKNSIWNINKKTQSVAYHVNSKKNPYQAKIELGITAEEKAKDINGLMSNYHKRKYAPNYSKRHPEDYLKTSRNWLREELSEQFGGNSESDDSDYEDSDSDTEYLAVKETVKKIKR